MSSVAGAGGPAETAGAGGADPGPGAGNDPPPNAPMGGPHPGTAGTGPGPAAAGTGSDPGAAGAAGVPPMTGDPPATPDGTNWLAILERLLNADPRVREANAMRRILDAMNNSNGAPPDVNEALDALGDMDCRRNSEMCVTVCGWAVSNCSYCVNDPECMARLDENCRRSCR